MLDQPVTLRDQIKKAKQQEEDTARADNPYQTAMSPAGIGSSDPDVSKMGGTPNQKQGVINDVAQVVTTPVQEIQPQGDTVEQAQQQATSSQDLSEAKTQQEYEADAASEKASKWSEAMQGFGSLGGRVESLILSQFSGTQVDGNAVSGSSFELDAETVKGLSAPGQEAALTDVLNNFQSAGTTEDAFQILADASELFADPSANIMEIVSQAYANDPTAQQQIVADAISNNIIDPDDITIDQLVSSGMLTLDPETGMIAELEMTESDLVSMLGENWNTLTPAAIDEKLQQFQEEELGKKDEIMEKLSDPTLDPNARAALVEELKKMGSVGELQAEQVAEEARVMASEAGKIVFNGEVTDVADLLQDEDIQEEVKGYLAGGEAAELWKENNPEFAEWLDREMADLKGQSDKLGDRLDEFTELQKEYEREASDNLSDESGGAVLSGNVMEALGFGDGFQASGFDSSSSHLYKALEDLGSSGITKQAIDALNLLEPEMLEELKGEFLSSPEGAQDLVNILKDKNLSKTLTKTLELGATIDGMTDVDSMVGAVTGQSSRAVQSTMSKLRLNSALGDTQSRDQLALLSSLFDPDGNGKMDSTPEVVAAAIKEMTGSGSLEDLVKGGGMSSIFDKMESANSSEYRGKDQETYRRLASYGADGNISPAELNSLAGTFEGKNTEAGLAALVGMRNNPELMKSMGIDPAALSKAVTDVAAKRVRHLSGNIIKGNGELTVGTDPGQVASAMSNTSTRNSYYDAEDAIRGAIAKASSPEEKAALQAQLIKIDKATSRVYLNNWGQELAYSRAFENRGFKSLAQMQVLFKNVPPDLLRKVAVKNPNGTWHVAHLKNGRGGGTTTERQLFMQYAMAAEEKLKRQGKSLDSETTKAPTSVWGSGTVKAPTTSYNFY